MGLDVNDSPTEMLTGIRATFVSPAPVSLVVLGLEGIGLISLISLLVISPGCG